LKSGRNKIVCLSLLCKLSTVVKFLSKATAYSDVLSKGRISNLAYKVFRHSDFELNGRGSAVNRALDGRIYPG
jgi:hypothetical protein